eukprot:gene11182-11263_t
MAVKALPNLFFIGEVVDVTGWLGGYNFQWAWSSGFAADSGEKISSENFDCASAIIAGVFGKVANWVFVAGEPNGRSSRSAVDANTTPLDKTVVKSSVKSWQSVSGNIRILFYDRVFHFPTPHVKESYFSELTFPTLNIQLHYQTTKEAPEDCSFGALILLQKLGGHK